MNLKPCLCDCAVSTPKLGSALVDKVTANLGDDGTIGPNTVDDVLGLVRELAGGVRGAHTGRGDAS